VIGYVPVNPAPFSRFNVPPFCDAGISNQRVGGVVDDGEEGEV
jgi:hypothetical protein